VPALIVDAVGSLEMVGNSAWEVIRDFVEARPGSDRRSPQGGSEPSSCFGLRCIPLRPPGLIPSRLLRRFLKLPQYASVSTSDENCSFVAGENGTLRPLGCEPDLGRSALLHFPA
jgi:hypothetical protein